MTGVQTCALPICFSLEWSRIEPSEGEFSQEAMEHYIDEIKHLLAAGIKPLITLHHFSNPLWFEDKGAFLYKKNNHYFDNMCDLLVKT